jgi:hypothetical protein
MCVPYQKSAEISHRKSSLKKFLLRGKREKEKEKREKRKGKREKRKEKREKRSC